MRMETVGGWNSLVSFRWSPGSLSEALGMSAPDVFRARLDTMIDLRHPLAPTFSHKGRNAWTRYGRRSNLGHAQREAAARARTASLLHQIRL